MRQDDREVRRDRDPTRRHRRAIRHRAGLVDTGFIGDGVLDQLPTGSTLGHARVGGVDLNKPRMRNALKAVLALAPAPNGFTVAEFTAKVHAITGISDADTPSARPPTTCARSAANSSLTSLHGHAATTSHPRLRAPSPPCSPSATRSSRPSSPGIRSPRMGRKPNAWTSIDRDYEQIRINMQTLFDDLALTTSAPLAA